MESGINKKTMVVSTNNCNTIQTILDINAMIDIHAKHLEGLRTQCSTSAELIQQEIRTIEGKLVKLFSRQMVAKSKIPIDELPSEARNIPSVKQWLQVVGVSQNSVENVCSKFFSLELLQELSDHEIRRVFQECGGKEEELRRLIRALQNLRRYTEVLIQAEKEEHGGRTTPDLTLYWDSWDNATGSPPSSPQEQNINISTIPLPVPVAVTTHNLHSQTSPVDHCYTPPPTPSFGKGKGDKMKFPATPPPRKKNQVMGGHNPLLVDFPLTKSTSHESQLANRIDTHDTASMEHLTVTGTGSSLASGSTVATSAPPAPLPCSGSGLKNRLAIESSGSTTNIASGEQHPSKPAPIGVSALDIDDHGPKSAVTTPKSPRTPTVTGPPAMIHSISHRFTMTFKMLTTCDLCHKQMFIGLKCKECKYKCHRDCANKVPPSCRLPPEYVNFFRQYITDGPQTPILQKTGVLTMAVGSSMISVPSPSLIRLTPHDKKKSRTQPAIHMTQGLHSVGGSTTGLGFGLSAAHFDSSSTTSSCSSSTPSSPALLLSSHITSTHTPPSASRHTQFPFPDVSETDRTPSVEALPTPPNPPPSAKTSVVNLASSIVSQDEFTASQKSQDSDKTVSVSGLSGTSGSNSTSTDSERTYRVDSQDSQVSDNEAAGDRHWPRQNSLSLREWDIPFDELQLGESVGKGRFGTVHRGNWHGDVAIRLLSMDQVGDEKVLESFKQEVATFRKTRHENLVLFMGACMNLPTLALVTSMCKGLTLYTHLHLRKDKFNMNKTVIIAQQISQGMGYLHARGIVHKDLKSKNIFLENGKVVITDFGLFSVSKLCKNNGRSDALSIPPGWLCYLAPEVMRSLKPNSEDNDELPFTMASDVYSFGTVWYELLCGEWPFKEQSPEAMIWQIGRGMKQSLANLQASRDLKDILMACWAFEVSDRTEFSKLLKILERLPRKRLVRSPSHPVHLSRSAESVF